MSIYEKTKAELVSRGMDDFTAAQVMELAVKHETLSGMQGHWDKSEDGYPPFAMASVWMNVKIVAMEWISANLPMAWYRPMFE